MGTVKIESVDVQDDGRAVVSGTAAPGARVRVALSGRPLDTAIAGDDGRWEVQTAQPVSGLYTVSADVVDATGAVRALAVPVFAMLQAAPATNTPTPVPTATATDTPEPTATATPAPRWKYARST